MELEFGNTAHAMDFFEKFFVCFPCDIAFCWFGLYTRARKHTPLHNIVTQFCAGFKLAISDHGVGGLGLKEAKITFVLHTQRHKNK